MSKIKNRQLERMPIGAIKGNPADAVGANCPIDLTPQQTIDIIASMSGDANDSLRGDGTWAPAEGGVTLPIAESDVTGLPADLSARVLSTRAINTTAPVTGGGDLSADKTIAVSTMGASGSSHARGVTPDTPSTAGDFKFLREDATWAVPVNPHLIDLDLTIPSGYSMIVSRYVEIASGSTLDIGADSDLEVT